MIWSGALVLIGYYTTEAIKNIQQGVEYVILFATALFLVLIVWLGRRALKTTDPDADKVD